METRVTKSQTLYPFFSFACFFIVFFLCVFSYFQYQSAFSLVIALLLSMGIMNYCFYVRKLKKQLQSLILISQDIIEQKPHHSLIIDGESPIAVLSSHLTILDTRMKAMIERLHLEKAHLKDYIEDISHQIKTPLTSMILREEMLLEMIQDESQKELLLQIYHQTEKIKDLVESLLHLAQIESHSIDYHKKEYILKDLLEHISESLSPLKEKYDVYFHYFNTDTLIYCDEKWMSEAIENILKNCIEQKEHSTIDISCQNHSSYLTISIQDHGDGFLKEDLPHIFERFYRGKHPKGDGIGIGLAMSKGIIEAHHGHIEVMNHQGALFQITLPYKNTKSKFMPVHE